MFYEGLTKVYYLLHKTPPLVRVLSWMTPVYFSMIHFNIILTETYMFRSGIFSSLLIKLCVHFTSTTGFRSVDRQRQFVARVEKIILVLVAVSLHASRSRRDSTFNRDSESPA